MKHEYDDEQINDASRTAANYGSCGELHSNYLRCFLDALPDQQDEWEECAFEDIQKGDRVKRVMKNSDGTTDTIEGPATFHHLTGWGTNDHYLAFREDDSQDNITLFRIPAPVQHPDPEVNRVVFVHATAQQRYDSLQEYPSPVFHFHWSDNKWRGDISTVLDTEDILEWEPAKVVADND